MLLLKSVVVGANSPSQILFTNLPAGFSSLIVIASLQVTGISELCTLTVEGSTAASGRFVRANNAGATATSGTFSATPIWAGHAETFSYSANIVTIHNYASNRTKVITTESAAAGRDGLANKARQGFTTSLRNTTLPITNIGIIAPAGQTFVANSTAYVYLLKAGSDDITTVS